MCIIRYKKGFSITNYKNLKLVISPLNKGAKNDILKQEKAPRKKRIFPGVIF